MLQKIGNFKFSNFNQKIKDIEISFNNTEANINTDSVYSRFASILHQNLQRLLNTTSPRGAHISQISNETTIDGDLLLKNETHFSSESTVENDLPQKNEKHFVSNVDSDQLTTEIENKIKLFKVRTLKYAIKFISIIQDSQLKLLEVAKENQISHHDEKKVKLSSSKLSDKVSLN